MNEFFKKIKQGLEEVISCDAGEVRLDTTCLGTHSGSIRFTSSFIALESGSIVNLDKVLWISPALEQIVLDDEQTFHMSVVDYNRIKKLLNLDVPEERF